MVNNRRTSTGLKAKLASLRAEAAKPASGFSISQKYRVVFEVVRKRDGEVLEGGVDLIAGQYLGVISHVPAGASADAPRQRRALFTREQIPALADLLVEGAQFSHKRREADDGRRFVELGELQGDDDVTSMKLVATPNGGFWNVKLQGSDDAWLPFSHLDAEALAEALEAIEAKFAELEDGF